MVHISQLVALTALLNGSVFGLFGIGRRCDRLKIKLTTYDDPSCSGVIHRKSHELKQGKCYNFDDFQSAAIKVLDDNKTPTLAHRNCSIWFFDNRDCKGHGLSSGDIRRLKGVRTLENVDGVCGDVINHSVPPGSERFAQAHSARWYCIPDDWQKGMHTDPCCSQTTNSVQSQPIVPIPVPDAAKSRTTPLSSKSSAVSLPPVTATVKETTTVLFPPKATLSGTTTVYVAPSRKLITRTHVTTLYEDESSSSSATSTGRPAPRRKRDDSVRERKINRSKALKVDGVKPTPKPVGNCYGWAGKKLTVTDCDKVVPPPAKASPHLHAWEGQA